MNVGGEESGVLLTHESRSKDHMQLVVVDSRGFDFLDEYYPGGVTRGSNMITVVVAAAAAAVVVCTFDYRNSSMAAAYASRCWDRWWVVVTRSPPADTECY